MVEPQLGEEDINSMTIEELREFINEGVAPTALQSGESNTDLVRFRKSDIAKLKCASGTVIFFLLLILYDFFLGKNLSYRCFQVLCSEKFHIILVRHKN